MVPKSTNQGSYKLVLLFTPFFSSERGRGWTYTKSGVLDARPFLKHLALLWVWVERREEVPRERCAFLEKLPGHPQAGLPLKVRLCKGRAAIWDNLIIALSRVWPADLRSDQDEHKLGTQSKGNT